MGSDFCEALNGLNDNATNVDIQLTKDINGLVATIFFYYNENCTLNMQENTSFIYLIRR